MLKTLLILNISKYFFENISKYNLKIQQNVSKTYSKTAENISKYNLKTLLQ